MRRHNLLYLSLLAVLFALAGCGKPSEEPAATSPAKGQGAKPGLLQRMTSKQLTIPEGAVITVRLGSTISSKGSRSGDTFSASVAEPVMVEGKTAIPEGAAATGTVAEAHALGKFKGGALLRITLDAVTVNGAKYNIQTSTVARAIKGKGKRSAAMIGGGAGAGALIGALAGGGKGAAIGAAVGAGAGTAGAAFTGNKDIVLPAESALSFRLLKALEVRM